MRIAELNLSSDNSNLLIDVPIESDLLLSRITNLLTTYFAGEGLKVVFEDETANQRFLEKSSQFDLHNLLRKVVVENLNSANGTMVYFADNNELPNAPFQKNYLNSINIFSEGFKLKKPDIKDRYLKNFNKVEVIDTDDENIVYDNSKYSFVQFYNLGEKSYLEVLKSYTDLFKTTLNKISNADFYSCIPVLKEIYKNAANGTNDNEATKKQLEALKKSLLEGKAPVIILAPEDDFTLPTNTIDYTASFNIFKDTISAFTGITKATLFADSNGKTESGKKQAELHKTILRDVKNAQNIIINIVTKFLSCYSDFDNKKPEIILTQPDALSISEKITDLKTKNEALKSYVDANSTLLFQNIITETEFKDRVSVYESKNK